MKLTIFNKDKAKLIKKVKIKFNLPATRPAVHRKVVVDAYQRACVHQEQPFSSCWRAPHHSLRNTALLPHSYHSYSPLTFTNQNQQNEASKPQASGWEDNTLQLMQWEKIHIRSLHNKHSCIQLSFVMMVSHFLLTQPLDLRQNQIYCVEATALLNAPTPLQCKAVQESTSQGH